MIRNWKWRLEKSGAYGRWTKTHVLVLDFLAEHGGHLGAKEIYRALSATQPRIGLATIYRTLELLTRLGFLNRFLTQDGQNRYEFKGSLVEAHHHHLICLSCGQIMDTTEHIQEETTLIRKMEESIRQKYTFPSRIIKLIFTGSDPSVRKIWFKTEMFIPGSCRRETAIMINSSSCFPHFQKGLAKFSFLEKK